jgi:ribonuclease Z
LRAAAAPTAAPVAAHPDPPPDGARVRPFFHPHLVNQPWADPGLYVELLFERRSLLFDAGDLRLLAPRKILRVSDVFISHAHMDHFMGLDWLLRICLGRNKTVRLFGPPGFLDQVEHKLAAYSWNLTRNYDTDFGLTVAELFSDGGGRSACFSCHGGFLRDHATTFHAADLILLDEPAFRVRATFLDHKIPCLAFALEEKTHVNIWRNCLAGLGVAVGPWLKELKYLVLRGAADDSLVTAPRADAAGTLCLPLGLLKAQALRVVSGEKLCYVTDCAFHPANVERIVDLARNSDLLFIEAMFLEENRDHAAAKAHLTARQAGAIARAAGARKVIPFHFSARYSGCYERLQAEVDDACRGS